VQRRRRLGVCWCVCAIGLVVQPGRVRAQAVSAGVEQRAEQPAEQRDGQHDFDFDIGSWKTHLSRLAHPLTGSHEWIELDGTTVVRKVWDGRANLAELEIERPTGRIDVLSLRLYNPQSHQWSLNTSNATTGTLGQPTVGAFHNGRGEFYDQEVFNGRMILVRNVWSDVTPTQCRFEQAFSDDGGKTWEVNWIAVDTRTPDVPAPTGIGARGAEQSASAIRQAMDDAWWTGPLLANSPATLPPGHFLIEPYLYDVISAHTHGFGSRSYVEYGLVNRLTVGVIPVLGYNTVSGGPSSSRIGWGDQTILAQYGVTRFHEGSWVPTIGVMVEETFPTGQFDRLGDRPSNGFGAGAYTTMLGINSQTYFWMPTGRILRMRFDVSEALSTGVTVDGVSVYGTPAGFHGHVNPGSSTSFDAAWEYNMTRRWVVALDVTYGHVANTRVTGLDNLAPYNAQNPSSDAFGFAPGIEYNWNNRTGVIVGTRLIPAGHNTTATVTPVMAINMFL
jgi:hypothetical protein